MDGENGKKEKPSLEVCPVRRRLNTTKLTDYFVQRRSNRKTQEAINAEKHELLVKAILDGQQDGLTVIECCVCCACIILVHLIEQIVDALFVSYNLIIS